MFKLDNNLLVELNLGALPDTDKNVMLGHIYETLEMRVGMKLAEQMSNEQLDDFERFIDGDIAYAKAFLDQVKAGWAISQEYQTQVQNAQAAAIRDGRQFNENAVISEFGALSWLETNFPGYKQVVAEELDKLKAEIKDVAPQILNAALANAAQAADYAPVPQPAPQQPMYQQPMPAQPMPGAQPMQQPAYAPYPPTPPAPTNQPVPNNPTPPPAY